MAAIDDLKALGYTITEDTIDGRPTWLVEGFGGHWQTPANDPGTVTNLTAIAQGPARAANQQTIRARADAAIDQLGTIDDQLTSLDTAWATMTNAAKLDTVHDLALALRTNERATRAILRLILRRFETA